MNVQCAYLITDVQQSPASHDEEGKKIEQVKKICGVPADGYLDGTSYCVGHLLKVQIE